MLRSAPLRVTLLHAASSASCRLAASLLPRRFATAAPQPVPLADALEPIAVGLGAFQNMLGIMYCGYMFLATSLLSVYCPLLHRPLRQYGAVRLDSDIMGELKEPRAYHHHDSHDGLCRHCHRRRQHRHSHQQDARTRCWLSPMKTGFAKQLKCAFILHSQIVSSYAVALVKQLLIGDGNRCRPCGFHHLFRGTHCLSVFKFDAAEHQLQNAQHVPLCKNIKPIAIQN